jgi:hypothetical protein
MKGTPQDPTPRRMTVGTKREWASVTPYGADDQRTDFTANRIAIERMNGTVVKERLHPSEHAGGTYAYMQSIGMVTDHTVDCFRYREIVEEFAHAN